MTNPVRGIVAGLVFGVVAAGIMLPMEFSDKTAAISAAFLHRFGIGLVIGCVRLRWPGWAIGLFFGLFLSLPDAIITKAYAPILILGAMGVCSSEESSTAGGRRTPGCLRKTLIPHTDERLKRWRHNC
jgi:hypothetical protein